MEMRNTADIRKFLQETLTGIRAGTISNTSARTRIMVARAYIDTLKVEVVVTQLGGAELKPVDFPIIPVLRAAE